MASLSFREEIFVDRLTALCAIKQVEHCTISWLPSGDVRVSGFWDCAPIQGELAATAASSAMVPCNAWKADAEFMCPVLRDFWCSKDGSCRIAQHQ